MRTKSRPRGAEASAAAVAEALNGAPSLFSFSFFFTIHSSKREPGSSSFELFSLRSATELPLPPPSLLLLLIYLSQTKMMSDGKTRSGSVWTMSPLVFLRVKVKGEPLHMR